MRQFYFHQHEKLSRGGTYTLQGATLLKSNRHQSNCVSVLSKVLCLIWRLNIIVLNFSLFPHCQTLQYHGQSYCTVLTSFLIAWAHTNLQEPACIQGHVNILLIWWGRKTLKPLEYWDWTIFVLMFLFGSHIFLIDHLQIFWLIGIHSGTGCLSGVVLFISHLFIGVSLLTQ